MKYISMNLYRKMVHWAMEEGMKRDDFSNLPTPIEEIEKLQAVPADHFFELHAFLDEKLNCLIVI